MKKTIPFALLIMLFPAMLCAQNAEERWMMGISANALDFTGPATNKLFGFQNLGFAATFSAHGWLSKAFNANVNASFSPNLTAQISEINQVTGAFIDVNGLVQLKSNGTIFKENAVVAPYLAIGAGWGSVANAGGFYLPGAVGMRVRISQRFALNFEGMYRQSLGANTQPMSFSGGIVFGVSSQKKPRKESPQKQATRSLASQRIPAAQDEELAEALADGFTDRDGDGVPDSHDLCPEMPGEPAYSGCPSEQIEFPEKRRKTNPVAREDFGLIGDVEDLGEGNPEPEQTTTRAIDIKPNPNLPEWLRVENAPSAVYFDQGSDRLTPEMYPLLDRMSKILETNPGYMLVVDGHTDGTGSQDQNRRLSINRANSIRDYLLNTKGVSSGRIEVRGYSSERPKADNDTYYGRQLNRRCELRLEPLDLRRF